jgi:hypothetical protein
MPHAVTVLIGRTDGDHEATILPSSEGKLPVAVALDRASALLGSKPGMLEVVILLSAEAEWDPAWGELI